MDGERAEMVEVETTLDTRLRELDGLEECRQCERLQKETWGEDFEACVPALFLMVVRKSGGILAGAVDSEDRLWGFVFGITGVEDGRPYHWSHMLAVHPEARGRGLGLGLKLFQRDLLLDRGIGTAVWTFDPLVSRNAHLNLNRLGVRVSRYEENMYGNTGSSLHGGLDTDRFLVRWELESPRVVSAIASPTSPRFGDFGERACALRVGENGGLVTRDLVFEASPVLIQIPGNFGALLEADPERLRLWRRRSREVFLRYLRAGYEVDSLCRRSDPDRYYYVLRPGPSGT